MGEATKWPQLLPFALFSINSRRIPLMGDVEHSIFPLELLTGVRPRNEAEAKPTNLLNELLVPKNPLSTLAHLGALRNEWIVHSREAKVATTTKFICKELKARERVLVWSGKGRRGKGKKLNSCWIGPVELLWVGDTWFGGVVGLFE